MIPRPLARFALIEFYKGDPHTFHSLVRSCIDLDTARTLARLRAAIRSEPVRYVVWDQTEGLAAFVLDSNGSENWPEADSIELVWNARRAPPRPVEEQPNLFREVATVRARSRRR